jgi:hypothetical protein
MTCGPIRERPHKTQKVQRGHQGIESFFLYASFFVLIAVTLTITSAESTGQCIDSCLRDHFEAM